MSYTKPEKASQSDGKPPSDVGSAAATNTSQGSFTLFDSSRKGDASAALFIPLAITPATEKEEYPGDRDLDPLLRPKFRRFPSVAYADPDTESHFVMHLFGDAFAGTSVIGYFCSLFFFIGAVQFAGYPGTTYMDFVPVSQFIVAFILIVISTINVVVIWRHRREHTTWDWERRKAFIRNAERLVIALVFTLPLVSLSAFPTEAGPRPIQRKLVYPFLITSCLASLLLIRVRAIFSIPIVLLMVVVYHMTIPFLPPLKRSVGNIASHTLLQVAMVVVICVSLAGLEVLRRSNFELFVRRRRTGNAMKQHEARIQKTLAALLPGGCVKQIIEGTPIVEDRAMCGIAISRLLDHANWSVSRDPTFAATAGDVLFSGLDERVTSYNCEKVKVLGDCYIASCGLRTAEGGDILPTGTIARNLFQFINFQLRLVKKLNNFETPEYVIGAALGPATGGFFGQKTLSYNIGGEAFRTAWALSRTPPDVPTVRVNGPPEVTGVQLREPRRVGEPFAWVTPETFLELPEYIQCRFLVYEGTHPVLGSRVYRFKPGKGGRAISSIAQTDSEENGTVVTQVVVQEEANENSENPLANEQIIVGGVDEDDSHQVNADEDASVVAERTSFLHQIARKSAMEWATEDQRAILESTSQGPEAQSPLDVAKTALNRGDRHWLLNVVHPKFEPTAEAQFWKWCDGEVITGRTIDLVSAVIFISALAFVLAVQGAFTPVSTTTLFLAFFLVGVRALLLMKINSSWWFLDFHAVTAYCILIILTLLTAGPSILQGDMLYLGAVLSINYLFGSTKVRWGWTSLCMCLVYVVAWLFSIPEAQVQTQFMLPLSMAIVCYAARVGEGLRRQGFGNHYLESALQAMFEFDLLLHRSLLHMIVPPYISNLVARKDGSSAACLTHWIDDAVLLRIRFNCVQPVAFGGEKSSPSNAVGQRSVHDTHTRNFKAVEAAMEAVNCTELVSIVEVVGDELMVGGPLLLPDKTDSPALYASAVIVEQFKQLRVFGAEDSCQAAALLLRLIKNILPRFKPREVTAVMSCQLGFAVVLGVVQPSFNILGPVARISSVLMDAAPPGYVGMTEAFASAARGHVRDQRLGLVGPSKGGSSTSNSATNSAKGSASTGVGGTSSTATNTEPLMCVSATSSVDQSAVTTTGTTSTADQPSDQPVNNATPTPVATQVIVDDIKEDELEKTDTWRVRGAGCVRMVPVVL